MSTTIQLKRGSRAVVNRLATTGGLSAGEPMFLTDEQRLAVATSPTEFVTFAKSLEIVNVGNDNLLYTHEKPAVVQEYGVLTAEKAGIEARADAQSVTTEKTAYTAAVTALTAYLGTLAGWNVVPGVDVVIVGDTFRSKFQDVYAAREALLTKIAEKVADASAAVKAADAQAAAISAAATDATAKANAAQAAAISTAATAAQAKADLALTNANAYADGIVSPAEARAISAAQTKADTAQAAAIAAAAADATAKANVAATTANWSNIAGQTNAPANNATVGAIAGTNLLDSAGNVIVAESIKNNLVDLSWWIRDAAIPWALNGEYNRIIATPGDAGDGGPKGGMDYVWYCAETTGNGNEGGGWNAAAITVNPNKTYRFALPIKRLNGSGSAYWGVDNVCSINTATPQGNPYFCSGSNLLLGRWYLFVGFIFPAGSTGNSNVGAGIYDCTTGELIQGGTNYNAKTNESVIYHRAYQYYASANADQLFGRPLISLVDGSEPSLREYFSASAVLNTALIPSITAAATTANWSNIAGQTNAPASNATVGATWGTNLAGQPQDISNLVRKCNFEDGLIGTWSNPYQVEIAAAPCPYAKNLVTHTRDSIEDTLIPVSPGETLYASAWLETTATSHTCNFGVVGYDKDGNVSNWIPIISKPPGQGWSYVTGSVVIAPSNIVSVRPWLQIDGAADAGIGYSRLAGLWLGRHAPGATANQTDAFTNGAIGTAATTAAWTGVTGTGKPADNASSDLTLVASGGCTVVGNSVIAVTGGWDTAGAYSREGFAGGSFVSARCSGTTGLMFGLNSDPTANNSYDTIDFAVYWVGNGTVQAGLNNWASQITLATNAIASDVWAIVYDGATLKWLRNGAVVYGPIAATPDVTYWFDSAFTGTSRVDNVRFGPMSSNAWTSLGAVPANITAAAGSPSTSLLNSGITLSATGVLSGGGGGSIETTPVIDRDREINRAPNWYPVGTTKEFKHAAAMGLSDADGMWITLETIKQYADSASGFPGYQYAYQQAKTWRRRASTDAGAGWTAWVQDLDTAAYTGSLAATKNLLTSGTLAGRPAGGDGDSYFATDTLVLYQKIGGVWSTTANSVTNTNQVTDGANLGGTAAWTGVTGAGKPADNATVGATLGVNVGGQITAGNSAGLIDNDAVGSSQIASLSAAKITAGSLAVGQYIQSAVYTAGSTGWHIHSNGTAEFSGVIVRGTVYATAGQIGGITIASNAVRAGQTDYNTGTGFHLGSDGRLSLGSSAGNRLTWDGTNLGINGQINVGDYTGYTWPAAGGTGAHLSAQGLLLGNVNASTGNPVGKYFQIATPVGGEPYIATNIPAYLENAQITTLKIGANQVTVPVSTNGGAYTGSASWQTINVHSVTLAQAGVISVVATANCTFYLNNHTWYVRIYINGAYSNQVGGTYLAQSAICVSFSAAGSQGLNQVRFEWYAGDAQVSIIDSHMTSLGAMR